MSSFALITPATVEPVLLADMKAHARVSHSADDSTFAGLITAARQKWERETSFYLAETGFRLTIAPSEEITLPLHPVLRIDAITYGDGPTTLAPETYSLVTSPVYGIGVLTLTEVPTETEITVDFTVGFENTPEGLEAWEDEAEYVEDDIVSNASAFYVCTADHTAVAATNEPGAGTDWEDFWSLLVIGNAPILAVLALKTLVTHWYETREAYSAAGMNASQPTPSAFESIKRNFI